MINDQLQNVGGMNIYPMIFKEQTNIQKDI